MEVSRTTRFVISALIPDWTNLSCFSLIQGGGDAYIEIFEVRFRADSNPIHKRMRFHSTLTATGDSQRACVRACVCGGNFRKSEKSTLESESEGPLQPLGSFELIVGCIWPRFRAKSTWTHSAGHFLEEVLCSLLPQMSLGMASSSLSVAVVVDLPVCLFAYLPARLSI